MGIFFNDPKPHISKLEFQKVRNHLSAEGFNHKQIEHVAGMFIGDLEEKARLEKGISKEEVEQKIDWMRKDKAGHNFSDHQINTIEEAMRKFI